MFSKNRIYLEVNIPPLIFVDCPVINLALSLAKNPIRSATYSSVPTLPIGIESALLFLKALSILFSAPLQYHHFG